MKLSIKSLSIKSFAIMICLLGMQFAVQAQQRGNMSPEEREEKQLERMVENLDLDESQVADIKEINASFAEKMKTARESGKEDRKAMRETMQTIQAEKEAEYAKILSEEQLAEYKKMAAKQGPSRGGRGNR